MVDASVTIHPSSANVIVSDLALAVLALETERSTISDQLHKSAEDQRLVMQKAMDDVEVMRVRDGKMYARLFALEDALQKLLRGVSQ